MESYSPQNPPAIGKNDNRLLWGGLPGASASLAISKLAGQHNAPLLIIAPDIHTASRYHRELRFFANDADLPILSFPDWETLPYDHFSPHEDIISDRLSTLYKIATLKKWHYHCRPTHTNASRITQSLFRITYFSVVCE